MFKMTGFILAMALLVCSTNAITKYDFNVCRINFCADKEASCISDESICMDAFAKTRICFAGCLTADQLTTYNKCWTSCKQASAYANNPLYYAVGQCYENICYLNQNWHRMAILLLFVLMIVVS